jgi:hypothetical protein
MERRGMYRGPEHYTLDHGPINLMRADIYQGCNFLSQNSICLSGECIIILSMAVFLLPVLIRCLFHSLLSDVWQEKLDY